MSNVSLILPVAVWNICWLCIRSRSLNHIHYQFSTYSGLLKIYKLTDFLIHIICTTLFYTIVISQLKHAASNHTGVYYINNVTFIYRIFNFTHLYNYQNHLTGSISVRLIDCHYFLVNQVCSNSLTVLLHVTLIKKASLR